MDKHTFKEYQAESSACPMAASRIHKRTFIKALGGFIITLGVGFPDLFKIFRVHDKGNLTASGAGKVFASEKQLNPDSKKYLGVDQDGLSRVYLARGDTPENNMEAILGKLGGIGKFIGPTDIVILKPNAQWWNQGMTNTNAMKHFMEKVLSIPGFQGEIIICDNHQFQETNARGWTTQERNGDYNYNELVEYFQSLGYKNVTKYHWQCAGPNPNPLQGDAGNLAARVQGPAEGDGYVWRKDMIYSSPLGRKCMLTYPVFTSSYSGTTIDLKDGAWKDGKYTGQPVKLINFSALNFHGPYVGFTASVKNFMGIVDMTCGFQGPTPRGYYNTHYIGLRDLVIPFSDKMPWRVQHAISQYNYRNFCHTGAVLGRFMKDIKKADLNIITAHWVGYGSRTNIKASGYPKAILAGTDPVALDYIASKEILLPLTQSETKDNYLLKMNDATDTQGPSYLFLKACHQQDVGNLDPKFVRVIET